MSEQMLVKVVDTDAVDASIVTEKWVHDQVGDSASITLQWVGKDGSIHTKSVTKDTDVHSWVYDHRRRHGLVKSKNGETVTKPGKPGGSHQPVRVQPVKQVTVRFEGKTAVLVPEGGHAVRYHPGDNTVTIPASDLAWFTNPRGLIENAVEVDKDGKPIIPGYKCDGYESTGATYAAAVADITAQMIAKRDWSALAKLDAGDLKIAATIPTAKDGWMQKHMPAK